MIQSFKSQSVIERAERFVRCGLAGARIVEISMACDLFKSNNTFNKSSCEIVLVNHQKRRHLKTSYTWTENQRSSCLVLCPVGHHRVRQSRSNHSSNVGVLVQCDPSIKAILSKINEENGNVFIQEDIDDETVLIHNKKLEELKQRLKDVSYICYRCCRMVRADLDFS